MTPPSTVAAAATGAVRFVPGYVLAGRYRMVACLGKGGMGEVWRADDLILEAPVALKLIYSADPEGRQRILDEVRLARQITHPAICRVFDVGEGDREGEVFYSMELVQGEDLATLLRRVGRLPAEKVLDVAQQLCEGMAAAHAHGILHRDLKPANVLIDKDGLVRITDFGIAVHRDHGAHGSLIGTPGYMAPEQLRPGATLSERTDVHAIGLILYELLVGRPAFDPGTRRRPVKPSALIGDGEPLLDRAILAAIADDPQDRPASVSELARLLTAPATGRRTRTWVMAAGAAAALALIPIAASLFGSRPAPPLTDRDTIMVADFVNTTGESVFDGTLEVALAVALEQSPFLKVLPEERVRETLRLMQLAPDVRVTSSIAREVARREQLKALVSGSIATLGSHYVIALEAINADTGEVLAREQVEVAAKEQVLASLGPAASRLREELGESLALIERFDTPLAQATTGSLEALHAYSLALDEGRIFPRPEAIPHLLRAIELDPEFAMAHALLSGVYANTGRSAEAPVFSRRAFELRTRVSERERFFISWRYHVDAEQAWEDALDLARSWTRTYPREPFAFNSLGVASAVFGHHEEAVGAFKQAIRLDDRFVPPHRNIVGSLVALDRFTEAEALAREAAARVGDSAIMRRMAYGLAFIRGDSTAMTRELAALGATAQPMWVPLLEARAAAFSGRMQAAHELYQEAARTAAAAHFNELGAQWTMEDAESHAIVRQCTEARREISGGLELSRDNFSLERAARALALCGFADASHLSNELQTRFPKATLTTAIHVPVIAAATALRRRDFARVIELLEPVRPYDRAPAAEFWPSYLRGEAYLGMANASAAAAQFQSILERRGGAPTSPLYAVAHLGAGRAAALSGDVLGARAAYQAFLELWNGADPANYWVVEAGREHARLQ